DFLASTFFMHGYFDWRIISLSKKILKRSRGAIIEVGANIGTETISLAKLNEDKVYSFEPVPENFQNLERIKTDNSFDNLEIFQEAVSDQLGKVQFKLPGKGNSGLGYVTPNPEKFSQE